MPTGVSHISTDDYAVVRDFIDEEGLWYGVGESPPRIQPILQRFGWVIRRRHDLSQLGMFGIAFREGRAKLLYMNAAAGCGAERTVIAHTLAHEVLGHVLPVDEIRPTELAHIRHVAVPEEIEAPTRAATAILLIPSAYIESDLSTEEIAAYCLTTERVVTRRLHLIAVGDVTSNVRRFDRRSRRRAWQAEPVRRRTGTDASG